MTKIKKDELLKMYSELSEETLDELGILQKAKEAHEEQKLLERKKQRAVDKALSLINEAKHILKEYELELRISRTRTKIVDKDGTTYRKKFDKRSNKGKVYNYLEPYDKEINEIRIPIKSPSPMKYSLIYLNKQFRHLFPGYMIPFTLKTNIGDIDCKVTSATKDTEKGDPEAGRYIKSVERNGLREFYNRNPDIKKGDVFLIKILEHKKLYELKILSGNE